MNNVAGNGGQIQIRVEEAELGRALQAPELQKLEVALRPKLTRYNKDALLETTDVEQYAKELFGADWEKIEEAVQAAAVIYLQLCKVFHNQGNQEATSEGSSIN